MKPSRKPETTRMDSSDKVHAFESSNPHLAVCERCHLHLYIAMEVSSLGKNGQTMRLTTYAYAPNATGKRERVNPDCVPCTRVAV